ncbi:MAG TPA: ATP-binding protein [Verrucomicrobiae bacterium]|nr:ATP-binding protein [Verrucomicrobiae bacterium]
MPAPSPRPATLPGVLRAAGPALAAGLGLAAGFAILAVLPVGTVSSLAWWVPTTVTVATAGAVVGGVVSLERGRAPDGDWAQFLGGALLTVAVLLGAAALATPGVLGRRGLGSDPSSAGAWLVLLALTTLAVAVAATPPADPDGRLRGERFRRAPLAAGGLAVLTGLVLVAAVLVFTPLLPELGSLRHPTVAGRVLEVVPLVAMEFPLVAWTRLRWRHPADPLAPWVQTFCVILLAAPACLLFAPPRGPAWYAGWAAIPISLEVLLIGLVFLTRTEGERRRQGTERIRRITTALRTAGDLDGLLDEVATAARDLTEADAAGIAWRGESEPATRLRAVVTATPARAIPLLEAAMRAAPQAIVGGEPATVASVRAPEAGSDSVSILPFHVVGHANAALLVLHGGRPELSSEAQETLKALAAFAALATQQACLLGELRGTLAALDEAVIVCDARGRVTSVNARGAALLPGCRPGLDLASYLGTLDWRDDHDRPVAAAGLPAVLTGRPLGPVGSPAPSAEVRLVGQQTDRVLAMEARPLPGDLGGTVAVFRDVTQQRELDRMKDDFVSTVSHELRTPLTSICGATALLRSGTIPVPESRQLLRIIDDEANRLHFLVEDLLALSRIDDESTEIRVAPVRVRPLLDEVVDAARAGEHHPITIAVSDTCALIPVDADRLRQVLVQLVGNAVKFSPSSSPIALRAWRAGDNAVFEVEDQGVGIPGAEREAIFQRFRRGPVAGSVRGAGTGIGLTVVRGLVGAMGGEVSVRAGAGGNGSIFRAVLPLSAGVPAPPGIAEPGGVRLG